MLEARGWHSRGYLPHFDDGQAIQEISYRLADSLPATVLAQLEEQTLDDTARREKIEHFLGAGHGGCVLRVAAHAKAVIAAWDHFDGVQYRLHAWTVMPNHVHILVAPMRGYAIGSIVGAWKSVSARGIFAAMDRPSASRKRHLWQLDYYDRFIRNTAHYLAATDYIHQNPVKAGLVAKPEDWPWGSAKNWERDRPRSQD
jgi:putative transposase